MKNVLRSVRAGFTLLEVMVSTAIMVVIVLTVVSIASDTLRVYDRAVADLSTQSEARGVLDAMDNDFSTAVLRADGRCWMEIVVPGSTGLPEPIVAPCAETSPPSRTASASARRSTPRARRSSRCTACTAR